MVLLATEHPRDLFVSCGALGIIYFVNRVSCLPQNVRVMCRTGKYCTIRVLQGPFTLGTELANNDIKWTLGLQLTFGKT